jgi:hypothetical protein
MRAMLTGGYTLRVMFSRVPAAERAALVGSPTHKEKNPMKTHVVGCLLIAALASYPVAAGGADQPSPKRTKRTCVQMREDIERISKSMKMPIKMTAGSWGDIPAPLRKLPAGAENCGVGSQGQVIIISPALGKELESHYAPLFAEVDCKPLKCTITSMTNCGCTTPDGGAGVLLTDTAAETYTIMFSKPKAAKKK